jgi:anti-sigma factor RsiW
MHPSDLALNDYVDGTLTADDRTGVERHLDGCAECRKTVDELRRIKETSAALQPIAPPERAWGRIRADLAREMPARPTRSAEAPVVPQPAPRSAWPSWLAAAATVLLAVGISWFFVARAGRTSPPAATATSVPADAQAVEAELRQAEEHYQKAIAGLEQIANSEKGSLDPTTAATLEKNLTVVDQAIGESRAALRQQPTSEPAQQSLLENFRTKLALLEDTVALINEMRKGNDTGAARIASGLKHKG